MGFVRNLVLFPAVKMFFENLLRTDKVICHEFGALIFLGHSVHLSTRHMGIVHLGAKSLKFGTFQHGL